MLAGDDVDRVATGLWCLFTGHVFFFLVGSGILLIPIDILFSFLEV